MATDPGRVERVRLLLLELETVLGDMEREIGKAWQDSAPADRDVREQAYADWRAAQRLRRKLTGVLTAAKLEHPNG